MKNNEVARGVRVKLNTNFEIKSLSDKFLACEPILFICESHIYNNEKGPYTWVRGGSLTNSGAVHLSELELEFPMPERPLYSHEIIDYQKDLSEFKNHL